MEELTVSAFEFILKYLTLDEIALFKSSSKKIQTKVDDSFYHILRQKIIDLSIYSNLHLHQKAQQYTCFEYLSAEFKVGLKKELEDNEIISVQDHYELIFSNTLGDATNVLDIFQKSPIKKLQTKSINIKWLSIRMISIIHLTHLYCYFK